MPRVRIDLDSHRTEIELLYSQGRTQPEIIEYFKQKHDIKIARATLQRRLHAWGIVSLAFQHRPELPTGILVAKIEEFVHRHHYNDEQMVAALAKINIISSISQVKTIRLNNGWTLRADPVNAQTAAWERTKDLCWQAVLHGPARNWGRGHLQTYLQIKFSFHANINHVQAALKMINEERGVDRRPNIKPNRRHEALFHGPNFLWSIDGHAKLSPYGIDIYGAVDAYSRKIIWIYVGVSNQTQVSTCKQFLLAVQAHNIRPRFIRADRGTEIDMLLDVQFNLHRTHMVRSEQCAPNQVDSIRSASCIILGKSTANQRIESIWRRLLTAQEQPWRELFAGLSGRENPLFRSDCPSDMVILLYVFMDLIREEIYTWRDVHNFRRIRKDPKRPNHVAGVPNDLWAGVNAVGERPTEKGLKPSKKLLKQRLQTLINYGKQIVNRSRFSMTFSYCCRS